MTDISRLAATRCTELAESVHPMSKEHPWRAEDFIDNFPDRSAFRQFVEQAHTLATEALAHPEGAAEILAPLILREPVDPDLLIAREFKASVLRERGLVSLASDFIRGDRDDYCAETVAAIKFYRQREGGGNG